MTISEAKIDIRLKEDESGVLRVSDTRVTLDVLVRAFDSGSTPEEIVQQYPSLDLASAYEVIGYYLRNQEEVRRYLTEREEEEKQMKTTYPFLKEDTAHLRERLMKREK